MTHSFTIEFELPDASREAVHHAAEALMDELVALEAANCGAHSAAVSADLGRNLVAVELAADEADMNTSRRVVESCVRAAIHAAGGATPTVWPESASSVRALASAS